MQECRYESRAVDKAFALINVAALASLVRQIDQNAARFAE
jgi:hypothetical protein